MGISIRLQSITQMFSKNPTNVVDSADTEREQITYYRGDLEFDEYESRMKAMFPTEDTLPKNFLGPGAECSIGDATRLNEQIFNTLDLYHRGYAPIEEVKKTMSRIVADLRSTYAAKGFDPDEFTGKLIEDVYNNMRMANVSGASTASWYEARPTARAHNPSGNDTNDWVYYNADHYYASEEMKGTLLDMARKIGEKYGINQLNLPTDYPDGDVRRGIYTSYNKAICNRMRNDSLIGNILDETMVPPKGLKFFYMANDGGWDPFVAQLPGPKNDPYAAFDSFLSISYGNWSYTGRVPVRMDSTQFPISVNMFDVVNQGAEGRVPQEISGFLKNVDFFSMVQGGPYKASHPRKY